MCVYRDSLVANYWNIAYKKVARTFRIIEYLVHVEKDRQITQRELVRKVTEKLEVESELRIQR